MADRAYKKPRRRKKRNVLFAPVAFILTCAALAFGLSVFFRISTIEVVGIKSYSYEEIVEASGIEEGDNLFLIRKSGAISRIYSKLPYIDRADIERVMPNRLIINVEESGAVAYVESEEGRWTISKSGKILSKSTGDAQGLIKVVGVQALAPSEGELMSAGQADSAKVKYLTEILTLLDEKNMIADVTEINVTNSADPTFSYLGRFTVKLGKNEDLDYKLEMLKNAVAKLTVSDRGVLDLSLSVDHKAHFMPE